MITLSKYTLIMKMAMSLEYREGKQLDDQDKLIHSIVRRRNYILNEYTRKQNVLIKLKKNMNKFHKDTMS